MFKSNDIYPSMNDLYGNTAKYAERNEVVQLQARYIDSLNQLMGPTLSERLAVQKESFNNKIEALEVRPNVSTDALFSAGVYLPLMSNIAERTGILRKGTTNSLLKGMGHILGLGDAMLGVAKFVAEQSELVEANTSSSN